ncbi:MAG: hypothetical protein LLG02_00875 [Pelosinus sp.]|nr:hypothetical protein [Pelosinus sp.]
MYKDVNPPAEVGESMVYPCGLRLCTAGRPFVFGISNRLIQNAQMLGAMRSTAESYYAYVEVSTAGRATQMGVL